MVPSSCISRSCSRRSRLALTAARRSRPCSVPMRPSSASIAPLTEPSRSSASVPSSSGMTVKASTRNASGPSREGSSRTSENSVSRTSLKTNIFARSTSWGASTESRDWSPCVCQLLSPSTLRSTAISTESTRRDSISAGPNSSDRVFTATAARPRRNNGRSSGQDSLEMVTFSTSSVVDRPTWRTKAPSIDTSCPSDSEAMRSMRPL